MQGERLFLLGWDEIGEATGMSEKTLKRLLRDDSLPVVHIGGRPVSSRKALNNWFEKKLRMRQPQLAPSSGAGQRETA